MDSMSFSIKQTYGSKIILLYCSDLLPVILKGLEKKKKSVSFHFFKLVEKVKSKNKVDLENIQGRHLLDASRKDDA